MKRYTAPISVLTLLLTNLGTALAETVVPIYEGTGLAAEAKLSTCSSGCSQQMSVTARHVFVFDGNYDRLYNELAAVSIKVTAYDDNWVDAASGDLTLKVGSSVHTMQRWRRTLLARRKVEQVVDSAALIMALVSPGQTVTLEFLQDPQPLSGTDFTVNVKQYIDDTIRESRSRAVTPEYFSSGTGAGGEGRTVEP